MAFNGSGEQTIVTIMQGMDTLTNGLLGLFLLIIVFGIVYYMNRGEPTRETMVGATFVTMIVALIGSYIGLIQEIYLGGTIAIFVGALALLVVRN